MLNAAPNGVDSSSRNPVDPAPKSAFRPEIRRRRTCSRERAGAEPADPMALPLASSVRLNPCENSDVTRSGAVMNAVSALPRPNDTREGKRLSFQAVAKNETAYIGKNSIAESASIGPCRRPTFPYVSGQNSIASRTPSRACSNPTTR